MKKTGIELIAQERQEQIEKHGYTAEYTANNPNYYNKDQLSKVASGLIFSDHEASPMQLIIDLGGAEGWNANYLKYAESKSYKDRLIIAGALLAAEIDRIQAIDLQRKHK